MRYPPHFLERLRAQISLPELIGKRAPIRKHGREFLGLCPFHQEKSPSFHVYDDHYHCFGCGAHGDAIAFIMAQERLTYPETIVYLAREAGMELPQPTREDQRQVEQQKTLHDAAEAACQWFEKQLNASMGAPARAYIEQRGLSALTVQRYRIGYAPDNRNALHQHLLTLGFSKALQQEAGLIGVSEQGEAYDRFRARLMFPIRNSTGKVIAFGGRLLESATTSGGRSLPKYLNSPETPLFKKSELLYNLDLAKRPARDGNVAVVMEGYMDVVSTAQAGIGYALATLGTAVTAEHLRLLWQLAKEPVMCLDGDAAGQRAMLRAADIALPLLKPGFSLRFASLPKGEDPDSTIRKHGKAAFEKIIAGARPLSQMLWESIAPRYTLALPEGRSALEAALKQLTDTIAHPGVKPHYVSYFRQLLWEKSSVRPRAKAERSAQITQLAEQPLEKLIRRLLHIVLLFPQLLHKSDIEETLSRFAITDSKLAALRATMLAADAEALDDAEHFLSHISAQLPHSPIAALLTDSLPMPAHGLQTLEEAAQLWNDTVSAYNLPHLKEELKKIQESALDEAGLARLIELQQAIARAEAYTFGPADAEADW